MSYEHSLTNVRSRLKAAGLAVAFHFPIAKLSLFDGAQPALNTASRSPLQLDLDGLNAHKTTALGR